MEKTLHAPSAGTRVREEAKPNKRPLLQRLRADSKTPWMGPLCFLAVAAVLGVVSVALTVYTTGYHVHLDGNKLCTVKTAEEFQQVVVHVEDQVSQVLGYDYTMDGAITYEKARVEKDEIVPADGFQSYLFEQCPAIMQRHVLRVDGEVFGAAADPAALTALLEEIQAPYVNENTTEAGFVADVTVTEEYVAADTNQDLAAVQAALTANISGQTVYEVRAGDTFSQIANGNGMRVKELQELNPDVNIDRIYIGQLLTIKEEVPFLSVYTTEQVTYNQAVACPVEEVPDGSMYEGESRVIDAGIPGDSLVTADVIYVNGREEERTVLSTTILSEPTTRVIAVGTKERPSWYPNGYFIWPCYGNITSYFGYRRIFGSSSFHGGIDIAAPYGTRISAADGGTVEFAGTATGSNWSYGKLVIINHHDGRKSYYGHCSSILVSPGDKVYQGQAIARVGSTGRSTGNHCHFEIRRDGTRVNPLSYL